MTAELPVAVAEQVGRLRAAAVRAEDEAVGFTAQDLRDLAAAVDAVVTVVGRVCDRARVAAGADLDSEVWAWAAAHAHANAAAGMPPGGAP